MTSCAWPSGGTGDDVYWGAADGVLRIGACRTNRAVPVSFGTTPSPVLSVVSSTAGDAVAAALADGSVLIVRLVSSGASATPPMARLLVQHAGGPVSSLAWADSAIAVASADAEVRLYNSSTGAVVHEPFDSRNGDGTSWCAAGASPDGTAIALGGSAGSISVLRRTPGANAWASQGRISIGGTAAITLISWLPDGAGFVAASGAGTIAIINACDSFTGVMRDGKEAPQATALHVNHTHVVVIIGADGEKQVTQSTRLQRRVTLRTSAVSGAGIGRVRVAADGAGRVVLSAAVRSAESTPAHDPGAPVGPALESDSVGNRTSLVLADATSGDSCEVELRRDDGHPFSRRGAATNYVDMSAVGPGEVAPVIDRNRQAPPRIYFDGAQSPVIAVGYDSHIAVVAWPLGDGFERKHTVSYPPVSRARALLIVSPAVTRPTVVSLRCAPSAVVTNGQGSPSHRGVLAYLATPRRIVVAMFGTTRTGSGAISSGNDFGGHVVRYRHQWAIDYLDLSPSGRWLIFRDVRRQLFLLQSDCGNRKLVSPGLGRTLVAPTDGLTVDAMRSAASSTGLRVQETLTCRLLKSCSFAQWTPTTADIIVAQSDARGPTMPGEVFAWYDLDVAASHAERSEIDATASLLGVLPAEEELAVRKVASPRGSSAVEVFVSGATIAATALAALTTLRLDGALLAFGE